VSTVFRRLARRPAPPGSEVRPGSVDGPPDGWVRVKPTRAQRAGEAADSVLLRFTGAAAAATTRRQLLRRAGAVGGLLVGLSGTRLFFWTSPAFAAYAANCANCNCLDSGGNLPGPCGPSPICLDRFCGSGGVQCDVSGTQARKQPWSTGTCGGGVDTHMNCWTEDCCNTSWGHKASCCDCCVPNGSGGNCIGCEQNQFKKCICRDHIEGGCA
jgi:hypothetical protein